MTHSFPTRRSSDLNRESADRLIARLTEIGEERQRTDSASVRRAMGNLKAVLMNRLGERDLEEATLHDIVALIDEAAQKIERLRSEEHTSELQSLMRISYAVVCLNKKK